MPIFGGSRRVKDGNLDQRVCFELWAELGTLEKARLELCRRGIQHDNGDSYTGTGIRRAAFHWVIHHPNDSYQILQQITPGIEWEDFERWLVHRAMAICITETAFRKWLRKMDIYDNQKYRMIYDHRFPQIHLRE